MTIKYYLYLFLALAIVSCKSETEKIPNIDRIAEIYCTPVDFGVCPPLRLTNGNGWYAKYGSFSFEDDKEVIPLKSHYDINEDGDSVIVFDEYIDGKLHGSYIFDTSFDNLDGDYSINTSCKYVGVDNKTEVMFNAVGIVENSIFINPYHPEASFKLIDAFENTENMDKADLGSVNLCSLLHNNPETINTKLANESSIKTSISSDENLRTYIFHYLTGNGIGALQQTSFLQYKTGTGTATLDNVISLLFDRFEVFNEANFGYVREPINVMEAHIENKTYYLIEFDVYDSRPMPFEGKDNLFRTEACGLFAFSIEGEKLVPAKILENKSFLEVVTSNTVDDLYYKYDDKQKSLSIPIVDTNYVFKGDYRTIKLGK